MTTVPTNLRNLRCDSRSSSPSLQGKKGYDRLAAWKDSGRIRVRMMAMIMHCHEQIES
jgi:hypothetical protein